MATSNTHRTALGPLRTGLTVAILVAMAAIASGVAPQTSAASEAAREASEVRLDLIGDPEGTARVSRVGLLASDESVAAYAKAYGLSAREAHQVLEFQIAVNAVGTDALHEALGTDVISKAEFTPGVAELVIHVLPGSEVALTDLPATLQDFRKDIRIVDDGVVSLDRRIDHFLETNEQLAPLSGIVTGHASTPQLMSHTCEHQTGAYGDGGRLFLSRSSSSNPFTRVVHDSFHSGFDGTCSTSRGGSPPVASCTTALSATRTLSSGTVYEGVVTAGHCFLETGGLSSGHIWSSMFARDIYENFAVHRENKAKFEYGADAGFAREIYGSTSLSSDIYVDEETGFLQMTSRQAGAPFDNSLVCFKGANSIRIHKDAFAANDDTAGAACGEVIDGTSSGSTQKNPWRWARIRVLDQYVDADRHPVAGDSGGPVYFGSTLMGIITHGESSAAGSIPAQMPNTSYTEFYMYHADEVEKALGIEWSLG